MCKPDWRDWIAAVKKEIEMWLVFNAYSEIPFIERKPGSSIVPLVELYTRKRDESYKFRAVRLKLLDLVKREGEAGLKKFAAAHRYPW